MNDLAFDRRNDKLSRRAARAAVLAIILVLVHGCGSEDPSRTTAPPIEAVSRPSNPPSGGPHASNDEKILHTGPFEKSFDGIRFSVPAGWKEVELSPAQQGFIDARFQIPTPHGDVTLTCSSNAGGIDTNIQRWIGQFHSREGKPPSIESLDVRGRKATWVDLRGEFDAGPMGAMNRSTTPIERMLGVAIPLGARDFYLKLTGSDAAVSDIRAAFREFIREAQPE